MLSVQDAQQDTNGAIAEGRTVSARFFSGSGAGDSIEPGDYAILQRSGKDEFRLEAMDSTFGDDQTDSGRSLLRLHGPGRSFGCVTACDAAGWQQVDELVKNTAPIQVQVNTYRSVTLPGGFLLFRVPTGSETVNMYGVLHVK
jgi:hypothetical protein